MRSTVFSAALALALLGGTAAASAQSGSQADPAAGAAVTGDRAGNSANSGRQQESERRDVSPGNTGAPTDATSGQAPVRTDPGATGNAAPKPDK